MRAYRVTHRPSGEALDVAALHLGGALEFGAHHFGTDVGLTIEPLATDIRHLIPHPQIVMPEPATIHRLQPEEAETLPARPAPQAVPVHYDAEADEWVESTPARQQKAAQMQLLVDAGAFIQAIGLHHIREERLYLDMGFSGWTEYCERKLSMTRQHAHRLLRIGRTFAPYLDAGNVTSMLQLPEAGNGEDGLDGAPPAIRQIASLGITKMYELTKLDEEEVNRVVRSGEVALADGSTLDLDEIRALAVREFTAQLDQVRKAHRLRTGRLEEENARLKAEAEASTGLVEQAEDARRRAERLEARFGPVAGKLAEKERHMALARATMNDLAEQLFRIGVTTEDPEEVQHDLCDLRRKLDGIMERFSAAYGDVFYRVDQLLAAPGEPLPQRDRIHAGDVDDLIAAHLEEQEAEPSEEG